MDKWINIDEKMPEYYELIWASDGKSVVLSMLVGRSYTPHKKIFSNMER